MGSLNDYAQCTATTFIYLFRVIDVGDLIYKYGNIDDAKKYIEGSIETLKKMKEQDWIIEEIASMLAKTRDKGGTIYLIGNGGSASTAGHMAGDLTKTVSRSDKRGFKAVSLSDNIPVMLAWANDLSYDAVFEEQLKSFMTENDALIAISGSGNSKNIIRAVNFANSIGACTIGLTGMGGGELAKIAKISFVVPDKSMYRIEDLHLMLAHVIAFRSANASTSQHSDVYAP